MGFNTVGVIGLGYIGLPTAAILAANDVKVIGVDVKQSAIDAINRGEVPFVEPDLATYVAGAVKQGTLRATTAPEPADAFIVAVPTPFKGDHEPDLSYIESAALALAPQLRGGELIILESTSPPGATQKLADWILQVRPDLSLDGHDDKPMVHVAHCPERVLPGRVMIELVTNDRIVGGLTTEAAEMAKELYATFCQGEILLTDAVTAEMAKLVENSFRDVNIAFANELSLIADRLGIDVWELIDLANHHPRVNILQPGPGVGGHCIAVDPWFIIDADPANSQIIRTAREVNERKPTWVVEQIMDSVAHLTNPTIAALGLAFKPNIDDLRESPARQIVREISDRLPEATLFVVEPHIQELPEDLSDRANLRLERLDIAILEADAVAILVDHQQFIDALPQISSVQGTLIDTRGLVR